MVKDFLSRLEQSRAYRQLRTLWRVIRGDVGEGRRDEALDLLLSGYSIPKISALLWPGLGGPPLLERQRDIEQAVREYVLSLEKQVLELEEQIADMQRQQLAQQAQAAKDAQPAATGAVAAPDLLAGLLGVA